MRPADVHVILQEKLGFSKITIERLKILHDELLIYNKKYNLISTSTENDIWHRHILDSAQIVNFIDFNEEKSLADLGSGAGFPGMVLAIFNSNSKFHVKLYEKSPIKVDFLLKIAKLTETKVEVLKGDLLIHKIDADYIVARAFKKFDKVMKISREIATKSHKLIVLKGKSAQEEIKKASLKIDFQYKLENSITDKESKIILSNVIKSD